MKEEISQNLIQNHEKDSLISEPMLETINSISAKDKLESLINKQKQDFFDVYDLVGSFQYKENVSKSEAAENYFKKNYSTFRSLGIKSDISNKNNKNPNELEEKQEEEEEDEKKNKKINDDKMLDARESCLLSDRFVYQYYLFFCINLFQCATAFFYYEVDFNIYYTEYAEKYLDNIDTKYNQFVIDEVNRIKLKLDLYKTIQSFTLGSFYLTAIITIISNTILYIDEIKWKKSLHVYGENHTLILSPLFKTYLIESFILCISPFNFLNDYYIDYQFIYYENKVNRKIKINYIFLVIFIVTRILILVKFLMILSYYWSPRSQRFCKIFSVELNFLFVFKSLLRSHPFHILLLSAIINLIVGAYLIRMFERFYYMTPYNGLNNYFTCFWYCFISMMTVGYGDYSAISIFGRIIVIFVSLGGVFILAMTTVIFTEVFTFKGGQLKAYTLLKQIYGKEEIIQKVKKLVTSCGMIIINTRRKKKNVANLTKVKSLERQSNKIKKKVFTMLREIKILIKKYEMSNDINYLDMFNDHLVFVKNQLKDMDEKIAKFSQAIEKCNDNKRDIITIRNNLLSEEFTE